MKKRAAFILIFVLLGGLLPGCGCGSKRVTLTWALFDMKGDQQVYLDALNEKLREKGLPYQIRFANISIPFEGDYKAYVETYMEEVAKGDFDIITCPGTQNCYDTYAMMTERGLLTPWDDFLGNGETGERLKEAYPAPVWDAVKYKGVTYGIPTPFTDLKCYAVFHAEHAKKYGIDLETVQFSDLEAYLRKAAEEEESSFVVSTLWPYFRWGSYEMSPCEMVYIREEQGRWEAESMIGTKEGLEQIRLLDSWGRQGLIQSGDCSEAVGQGDFLTIGAGYSYSKTAAENLARNSFFVSPDVELCAVEFPEFNLKFNGKGHKAGVGAESANQEEAMEAVAAIYSDSELSNALVYGKEGESYQIENGLAVRPGEYGIVGGEQQISFGNPFLTMPSDKDSPNKKEELWSLVEGAELSGFAGSAFDLEGIEQNIAQLNVFFMERCQDILWGSSEDLEAELKVLSEEADALGLETVLEKLNQQLGEE